jgi:tRNA (guanine-N7-)-methyltransferase
MRVLCQGGRLELRTDSDNYFWYALETFFAVPKTEVEVRKNEALEITSKYEARWLKMEKDIYDVYVTCPKESEPKKTIGDFNFNIVKYHNGIEDCLPQKAVVGEDCFVHIERLYRIGKEQLLIKCSFGSFDRPEHKYLLLGQKGCRYFVSPPVKTSVNHKAHQKITELLSNVECN